MVQLSHPYMATRKTIALNRWTLVDKVMFLIFFKYKFIYFNWRLITLQYCIFFYWFYHTSTWIHHRYTCVPHPEPPSFFPPHTIPVGHLSAPAPSIQYPASNLDWWFVSYMILYMFQCHSPKSSHPLLLPQSPKDCSINLYSPTLTSIHEYWKNHSLD